MWSHDIVDSKSGEQSEPMFCVSRRVSPPFNATRFLHRVTGGELFEDIVAREYYSEADAR